MEGQIALNLQLSSGWINSQNVGRKPNGSVHFSWKLKEQQSHRVFMSSQLRFISNGVSGWHRMFGLKVPCSCRNSSVSTVESGSFHAPFDANSILKNKSQELAPYLNGCSIYLVGMMGSGKTTVGKILSKVLGYSFCDSDAVIEEDMGVSVAEIFKLYGEGFFREKESQALQKLSLMHRLVVATGGGAVVSPINWRYMQKGVSVWLDVPLGTLAQRIVSVGTDTRPLLHYESGDKYNRTFIRLSTLMEERIEAYANANARVSLENMATKMGQRNVCDISSVAIAIEALEQIGVFLRGEDS